MATVVNNAGQPPQAPVDNSGNGMGMIVGALLFLAVVFLLIFYGIPAMRRAATPPTAPANPATTEITVPDQIDVNVTTPEGE